MDNAREPHPTRRGQGRGASTITGGGRGEEARKLGCRHKGLLTFQVFCEPVFRVGRVVDFSNTPWMMPAIDNVARILIVWMMIGVGAVDLGGSEYERRVAS